MSVCRMFCECCCSSGNAWDAVACFTWCTDDRRHICLRVHGVRSSCILTLLICTDTLRHLTSAEEVMSLLTFYFLLAGLRKLLNRSSLNSVERWHVSHGRNDQILMQGSFESRPTLKSPWISDNWKSPWTVLEKEWKALKSLEFVYLKVPTRLDDLVNVPTSCHSCCKVGIRTA